MGLSAGDIVLRYVCPAAGGTIALFMFGAPLPAVLEVRRRRYIGETNALPFAAMGTNCMAWLFYAFLIRDWWVYVPNQFGLLMGWYYTFSCFKFSKDAAQDALTAIVLSTVMLYWVVGAIHWGAALGPEAARTLWGSTAVGVLAIYYVAPLTTIWKVLRLRDSSSLNAPLSVMNVVNGALWFSYGLAIKDWFIAMPNGVGAALNVICVILCFLFPKKAAASSALQGIPTAAADAGPMVRLQSANFSPRPADAPSSGGRGRVGAFFDLSQFRWRTGSSLSAAAGPAALAGAASGGSGTGRGSGVGAAAGSASSLGWLLRSSTIEEGRDDLEALDTAVPGKQQRPDSKSLPAKGDHAAANGRGLGQTVNVKAAALGGGGGEEAGAQGDASVRKD